MNGTAKPKIVEPSSKVDWANLKFTLAPTNGYVKYTWKDGAWNSGELVKKPTIELDVASVALNYGQSVFEGLKAYRHQDGTVRLFRPQENAHRINHSASVVSMPPLPEEIFLEACKRCVAANLEFVPPYGKNGSGGALYLRPLYFGSGGELALVPPHEFTFLVWCTPAGSLYGNLTGTLPAVSAWVVEDFDRAAPKGTGHAKLAGNYAPVFQVMTKARQWGHAITLHLDSKSHTYVDEFSTANCLLLSYEKGAETAEADKTENATLFVPESNSILKSVTTKSIVDVADKLLGWTVKIAPVPFADVTSGKFQEIAAAGTAAVVTPVKCVVYHTTPPEIAKVNIGNGETAGPAFVKVMQTITGIQSGDVEDKFGWLWPKEGIEPLEE